MGGTFSSSEMSLSGRKLIVKELHFLQDSRPLRFPKRHSLGGSCMCYLPGSNFFGPFYHTKKSLTIKFYRYTVVVYLPTKTFQRTPGRSRLPGPPLGVPRGPAAALGHLQVDEMPSLPWRGRRARSTRRAWSNKRGVEKVTTNEFLIAQWVILSWKSMGWSHGKATRWTHQMCFSKKNEPADIGVYHLLISIYFYTHMYMCTIYYNIIYI